MTRAAIAPVAMADERPMVSVLLPVRNARTTIEQSIESVLAQSFRNFECLVVDDGSSDGTLQWLKSRETANPHLRVVSQGRKGLVEALNLGLANARGNYIARFDADDVMHRLRLAKQFAALEQDADLGLVASRVRAFPRERLKRGMSEYLRWQDTCLTPRDINRAMFTEAPFVHPSVMFRSSTVKGLGGYRTGDFPEDYELWLRLHRAGVKMRKLDEPLLCWRQGPGSLSRLDLRYRREAFDRIRAQYLAKDERTVRNRASLAYWGAGRRTRQRIRHLQQHGFQPKVWIDIDPKKIGQQLHGVPVVSPRWLTEPAQRAVRPFVLVYVANHGARERIAHSLSKMGYQLGTNYLMVG